MKIFYILFMVVLTVLQAKSQNRVNTQTVPEARLIRIYPNPAAIQITFNFEKRFDKNYSLHIFNFIGKKVHDLQTITPQTLVDVSAFYRGVYIFQVKDKAGKIIESGKFQVAK
ncbi:MAG: T9SS type A sorting domain-containing protein [Chitinophagaceae bacterium]